MQVLTTININIVIDILITCAMTKMASVKNIPICLKLITTILFMVCLVLQVDLVCSKEVVRCIQRERQALLHFKAGLVDRFGMLSSWTTDDCCQWKGIRCSNLTGHVLMLDLHGNRWDRSYDYYPVLYVGGEYFTGIEEYLGGEIHKSLMELQQLRYLNLSQNSFEDIHIPDFIGSLTNLRYLDLSHCHFGGKIPSQFGSLSNLKHLNLGWNDLEGWIPYQLGNLSKLQHLDFTGNSLEGSIPSQLGKLSNLHELYLSGAFKIDDGNHKRGQWLSNLTSLTHLYLSSMPNLNRSHSWLQMIGKLLKLRELSLSQCSLSDYFILSLSPSKFSFSTSLSVLDLSSNSFTSSKIFHWVSNTTSNLVELDLFDNNLLEAPTPDELGITMNSLELLDLTSNRLKGGVVKSFINLCTLRTLIMYENNLTEDLPSILHNLSGGCVRDSLQLLDLRYNEITGSLPDLSIFSSLKTLDLSYNRLSGKIPEGSSLPSQLEALSIGSNSLEGGIPESFLIHACKLRSLDVSNNSFSEELLVIIHHFSECAKHSLQDLDLSMNQINGTLLNLSIFSSLNRLDLSKNSLNGVITDSQFANMSMLKSLDLSDNSLSLTFTQNWVPPFQLHSISLRSCKLGLAFPKWLQTQNNIQDLDISNTKISDVVPEWFWAKFSAPGLRINISYNNFKGVIPNLPLKSSYDSLSLASNQFEGPIPPFLRGGRFLDLSKNKFSDSLWFLCASGIDETSYQLDLSSNQFHGQIPDCWNHFKSLAYLDLSHNNFLGKIPASIGSLVELQALILRNNSLIEEIPFSLMNCTKLVMLDARENRLSGLIPPWFGRKLQELQVLSLQRNHFFGTLPLEICYLQKIQLLDLSLNNLSGRIPKCIKNFTSMAQKKPSSMYHLYISNSRVGWFYELNAFVMWKGVEQSFNNNELSLLKSIDLSSNHFSEEIPVEIENLFELVSLNLSRNNLTGKIPSNIGKLTSLDFLDLSRNKLIGSIPSSLTQIDRLAVLDLSYNHLSGRIPTSTQLQSFNASSYENNLNLCGPPLENCVEGKPPHDPEVKTKENEDLLVTRGFYISMVFGFIIGFWGVFGSILIKRSWRHAYFKFLNNLVDNIHVMVDNIHVMVVLKLAKCKRWLKH